VLTYFWALMCVFGMAAGQILFKLAANSLAETGSFLVPRTATLLFTALALYGLITIAWIWVLQKAELGKVYPMMALAFVLVPLASHWLFGERFTPQYFIGIVLIMGGIVVAIQEELGVPVKLVGLGEGPDDLAPFDPEGFVDALLD